MTRPDASSPSRLAAQAPAASVPAGPTSPAADLPAVSPWLFDWFTWYASRYVAKHFRALRLLRPALPELPAGRPVIVYLNHPSWWDPLLGLCVIRRHFPNRLHYAPIESAALEKYRFFQRLGFFGIQPGTPRGARRFLKVAESVLADDRAMLWVTAQGTFVDSRVRPVGLRPGVGHLAARLDRALMLPLAVELTFWNERLPEALLAFGPPIACGRSLHSTPDQWTNRLEQALAETQDRLAAAALQRDPATFETLLAGRLGVNWFYDTWRRFRAALSGQRFHAGHEG